MPELPALEEGVVQGMLFIPSTMEVSVVSNELPTIAIEGSLIVTGTISNTNIDGGSWIYYDTGGTSASSICSVIVNGNQIYPQRFYTGTLTVPTTTHRFNVISSCTTTTFITGNIWTPQSYSNNIDWDEIRKKASAPIVVKKSTRNSIKRALKLMMGMGFEEDVRVFLNGDSIEISHPNSLFKFVITKYSRSLIRHTEHPGYSTPYKLELYTKSDVHIANLCVYMEETPILDQVLGVAMFIKSGSEEIILKEANWSRLTDDMETREILALEYPYLEKKMQLGRSIFNHNNNAGQWAS